MLDIKVIASGSSGNCYLINDGASRLLLDCGIPYKDIVRGCSYNMDICACLVSHTHSDHAKAVKEMLNNGVTVVGNKELSEAFGVKLVEPNRTALCGTFYFTPFNVPHCNTDGTDCENYGYLLHSKATNENLLFATDCAYIPHRFKDISYALIEVNYEMALMPEEYAESVENRRFKSHHALETAVDFLNGMDKSRLKAVYAIHGSRNRSDPERTKTAIEEAVGKEVDIYVCQG